MCLTDILNAFVLLANFVLIPALAYGAQLALGALGVTLIYAVLRFSNFAHGDLMAFGTGAVILATWGLQAAGVGIAPLPTALLALPVGIAAAMALALVTDRLVYRFYRQAAQPRRDLRDGLGRVMFIYNALTRFFIGADDQRFEDGDRFVIRVPDFREMTGLTEGLALRTSQLITVVVMVVVVTTALFWFLQRTRTGKAMRAYSDNEDLALLSGINPDRVVMITWMLAATLATIAGVLYGLDKSFRPVHLFPAAAADLRRGDRRRHRPAVRGHRRRLHHRLLRGDADLRLQGIRRLPRAGRLGSPTAFCRLLGTDYKFAVSFIILVVVLLIRPTGIFRGRVI